MQYILSLSDEQREHLVVFTLRESDVKRPAADFFFDIVGAEPAQLAEDGIISPEQTDDLTAIRNHLFDEDDQGLFIREDASILSNGRDLNPDAPLRNAFVPAERDGVKYMQCDAQVRRSGFPNAATGTEDHAKRLDDFARIWFIWQIANGALIDVTKDNPELVDSIAEAEKNGWIDIDVKKAAYKLTEEGQQLYRSFKNEAQDLIKRYDIYGDVDMDSSGQVHFDTGLGKDLRIPMFDMEGVDPFRARFLIGLNDGEFANVPNWTSLYRSSDGYEQIMKDVSYAPTIDDVGGRAQLQHILQAGKAQLRQDSRLRD